MKQSVTITGENLNVVMNGVSAAESVPVNGARMMSKAEMRIAALKAKGIDTSCYFPMGTEQVIKLVDGQAIPVDMTDDVEKKLVEGGYINNYSLFRRWVMAQMFRMLREMEKDGKNFTEILQRKGYEYQWQMAEREISAQVKMLKHGDLENLAARNRWFNGNVIGNMALDYLKNLKKYVEDNLMWRMDAKGNEIPKHTCHGVHYVRISGKNIFVSDLNKKLYWPLCNLAYNMKEDSDANSVESLYKSLVRFNKLRKRLSFDTKHSIDFINAYKGSGSYFTMRNLIMFHGARLYGGSGCMMTKNSSLKKVEDLAIQYRTEGWKLLGVLKELISDSNISLQGKIDEWKK